MLATYHLDGEAQLWYQLFKETKEGATWEQMKEGLHVRYGPTQFDDFFWGPNEVAANWDSARIPGSVRTVAEQGGKALSSIASRWVHQRSQAEH